MLFMLSSLASSEFVSTWKIDVFLKIIRANHLRNKYKYESLPLRKMGIIEFKAKNFSLQLIPKDSYPYDREQRSEFRSKK